MSGSKKGKVVLVLSGLTAVGAGGYVAEEVHDFTMACDQQNPFREAYYIDDENAEGDRLSELQAATTEKQHDRIAQEHSMQDSHRDGSMLGASFGVMAAILTYGATRGIVNFVQNFNMTKKNGSGSRGPQLTPT
jgi:hypothetical protein